MLGGYEAPKWFEYQRPGKGEVMGEEGFGDEPWLGGGGDGGGERGLVGGGGEFGGGKMDMEMMEIAGSKGVKKGVRNEGTKKGIGKRDGKGGWFGSW